MGLLNRYVSTYYTAEEMEQFLELTKARKLALLFQMTAFYGLRRSEVIGLKWDNIDFDSGIFTIRHVVTQTNVEGKSTLPLVGGIRERLEALQGQQEKNKEICGDCYNQDFLGYVFVDEMGNLYKPDMVTETFQKLLNQGRTTA